jgi:hypothetical protein
LDFGRLFGWPSVEQRPVPRPLTRYFISSLGGKKKIVTGPVIHLRQSTNVRADGIWGEMNGRTTSTTAVEIHAERKARNFFLFFVTLLKIVLFFLFFCQPTGKVSSSLPSIGQLYTYSPLPV